MNKRVTVIVGVILALLLVSGAAWYLVSPLFIDNTVNEDFPTVVINTSGVEDSNAAELATDEAKVLAEGEAMPDTVMDDPMPMADETMPVALREGNFKDFDSVHRGSGQAQLYQLPDGSHVLRFEDFEVTNGPDLHVLISNHPDPATRDEVMTVYTDLGSLKGNIGSQNYPIPAEVDVANIKSVVIYCMPFHVIFSTSPLNSIND